MYQPFRNMGAKLSKTRALAVNSSDKKSAYICPRIPGTLAIKTWLVLFDVQGLCITEHSVSDLRIL